MDFFETREKYRRREVHIYMRWLSRIFFLGLALWLGWQWGSLEQRQLQADADLALYEREQQIEELSGKVQGFEHDLRQLKACLLYTSPSPRDVHLSRMPSSA